MMMELDLVNGHESIPFDLDWLERVVESALPGVLLAGGAHDDRAVLDGLEELSIALVSDEVIAKVHLDFMNIPDATDVITFDHGEIVVSLDTARRYAEEFGSSFEEEVVRYVIHGLLHLNGHEDHDVAERAAMHVAQEKLVQLTLAACPGNESES